MVGSTKGVQDHFAQVSAMVRSTKGVIKSHKT